MTKPFENTPEPRFTGAYIFDTPKKMFSRGADVNTYGIYGHVLWENATGVPRLQYYPSVNHITNNSLVPNGFYWIGWAFEAPSGSIVRLPSSPSTGQLDLHHYLVNTQTGERTYIFSEWITISQPLTVVKYLHDVLVVDNKLWVSRENKTGNVTGTSVVGYSLTSSPTLLYATSPYVFTLYAFGPVSAARLYNKNNELYAAVISNSLGVVNLVKITTSGVTTVTATTATYTPRELVIKSNKAWFGTDNDASGFQGVYCIDLTDNSEAKYTITSLSTFRRLYQVLDDGKAVIYDASSNFTQYQYIVLSKSGASLSITAYPQLAPSANSYPADEFRSYNFRTSQANTFLHSKCDNLANPTAPETTTGLFRYPYASGVGVTTVTPGQYPPSGFTQKLWEKSAIAGSNDQWWEGSVTQSREDGYGSNVITYWCFKPGTGTLGAEIAIRIP